MAIVVFVLGETEESVFKRRRRRLNSKRRISMPRPVGTNLVLVRRVRANYLISMKAERAKRAERLTAWGPGAR